MCGRIWLVRVFNILCVCHAGLVDVWQNMIGACTLEEVAVRVGARIIGHYPHRNQLLIDVGWTALSLDGQGQIPNGSYCLFEDEPNLRFASLLGMFFIRLYSRPVCRYCSGNRRWCVEVKSQCVWSNGLKSLHGGTHCDSMLFTNSLWHYGGTLFCRFILDEWLTHSPVTLEVAGLRPIFGDISEINFSNWYSLQHRGTWNGLCAIVGIVMPTDRISGV